MNKTDYTFVFYHQGELEAIETPIGVTYNQENQGSFPLSASPSFTFQIRSYGWGETCGLCPTMGSSVRDDEYCVITYNKAGMERMDIQSVSLYRRYTPGRMPEGEDVAVVGQLIQIDEARRRLIIQLDESNKIEVVLPETFQIAEVKQIKYIQVRGKSSSLREVLLKEYTDFKDNFDLKTYNEVVTLTTDNAFRNVFGNK